MTKLLRSDIDREEAVKPLINAFKVPKLSEACRILFVNGDSLALSLEFGQTGLVSLQGATQGNIEGSDLLIAESETQLIAIIQQALPQFIEKLTGPIVSAAVGIASVKDESQRQSVFTAKIVSTISDEQEKQGLLKVITPYIGGMIKPLAEMSIGSLYKFYFERQHHQRQMLINFDDVVASLKRLDLISPFLSLAICPSCNNYEAVFSRFAGMNTRCPKCGSEWPVLMVNEFPAAFAALKKSNHDLPVFISAYLKSKSVLPIRVFPNAEVDLEPGKAEIDVLVEETSTGMECKCYTNNIAVAETTISSEAGKIRQQTESYVASGLTRVIIITNYCDSDTMKLRARLTEELKQIKGLREWKLLGFDLPTFAKMLNEESSNIEAALNAKIQKEFEGRMTKQLSEVTPQDTTSKDIKRTRAKVPKTQRRDAA